jgi:hypothetical protein
MVSPSVDNRVQEETTKSHLRRQDNTHGSKEEDEKKLKGGKRNTDIKAKGKCKSNASQSPALNTQEFVVAVTGESASKLLLVILKLIFLVSVPHPVK